ncbi:MAG: c-type cytochrome [Pirellulaceae bacterium]|nr:c-type cytochrome [Pirellulaceae bacterium]
MKTLTVRLLTVALIATGLITTGLIEPATAQRKEDQPDGPALKPAVAAETFTIAGGLKWTQLLSEPTLRQPLFSTFDARGRLWVVQYLQYPEPAGIKALSRDNFWRIVYDRLPKPPGQDTPGADRITIFQDIDGDGKYSEQGDFVNGLNIATSVLPTVDGAWVLNPPHLLFYKDADGDLKADGPPEVHLEGFGLEDTHSVVNSLCLGPDGWLYAAQGSTVTAAVRRYGSSEPPQKSLGQLIWRYHPQKRIYEIFAEGGGNAFGVAFDEEGRVYSGHNGGDTRGFHYVQGGYFRKGFTKHGSLSNPYSLGYLLPMPHVPVQRFSHTMLMTNGTALEKAMPEAALCVDPLHGTLVHSKLFPIGSTFRTEDIELGVKTTDKWFRPVAVADGPDGAAYVSDWYDFQVAHLYAHVGKLDKDHGRLYRLAPPDAPNATQAWDGSLATATDQASVAKLIEKLKHPLRWQRWHARQLLARHPLKASALPALKQMLTERDTALEALWAVHACGWLADSMQSDAQSRELIEPAQLMDHAEARVREWAVRLAADDNDVSAVTQSALRKLARQENDPSVLVQVAASAKRLPTDKCLQICGDLLDRDLPTDDPYLPLLIWWAVEKQCDQIEATEVALVTRASLYGRALYQQQIAPRIVERAGRVGGDRHLATIAKTFATIEQLPPESRAESAKACIAGFERAFAGRSLSGVPNSVLDGLARLGQPSLALQLRRGDKSAQEQAAKLLVDAKADLAQRLQVARILGEVPGPAGLDALLLVCTDEKAKLPLRMAAASSLAAYNDPKIGKQILDSWAKWPSDLRASAGAMLVAKPSGAASWLDALDAQHVKASDLPLEVVRLLRSHTDAALLKRVDQYYPPIGKVDLLTAQKRAAELSQTIFSGNGDPYRGKRLYSESCGRCHVLFDQGGQVGPNLTGYQRDQLNILLINVLAPNLEIREGFQAMVVLTSDGKLINGFIERENPEQVIMRSIDGQTHIIDRAEIESLKPQPTSLMPEGLLDSLTSEQLCDLFAYLRSSQPLSDGT